MPISLRLDPETETRLAHLAQVTGRSKTAASMTKCNT
ncbi:TraY domain-containing protein [Pistricoccus aurantiacus]|nr:TraY domain-containing protein [Pistricoccus aurantiacus]